MIRSRSILLRSLPLLVPFLGAACGSDEAAPETPKPTPTLTITGMRSAGGPSWAPGSGSCVELGTDPDATVIVTVAVTDFTLRPPGACGSARPCGTVLLTIDGTTLAQAASTEVPAKLGQTDAGVLGERSFRVELRDHLGDVVLDPEQRVIADEVVVEVRTAGGCSGAPDAAADAPPDATADAEPDATADAASEAGDAAGPDAASDASDAASE